MRTGGLAILAALLFLPVMAAQPKLLATPKERNAARESARSQPTMPYRTHVIEQVPGQGALMYPANYPVVVNSVYYINGWPYSYDGSWHRIDPGPGWVWSQQTRTYYWQANKANVGTVISVNGVIISPTNLQGYARPNTELKATPVDLMIRNKQMQGNR